MLIKVAMIGLIIYNLIFFWTKLFPFPEELALSVYEGVQETKGFLTLLEILGIVSVFIDLVGRYEQIGERIGEGMRRGRVFLTGLFVILFFFKLFVNYLDSAFA